MKEQREEERGKGDIRGWRRGDTKTSWRIGSGEKK